MTSGGSIINDTSATNLLAFSALAESEADHVEFDIKELAQISGHSVRNLRAYLQLELLQPGVKQGRSLFFGRGHVRRLQQIDRFRARGYSLAAIKDVVSGRGDALIASDVASITNLIKRWVADDDHHWTMPEIERLVPDVREQPELIEAVIESGIGRLVDDGLVITRPELFRLGYDLSQRGMPIADALTELQRLNSLLDPLIEYLGTVYDSRIASGERASNADPLESLWPAVMLSIGSQLTREMLAHIAGED